jgi:signal transduction histidine kinase
VKHFGFRARLLWILLAFAIIPAVVLTIAGAAAANRTLPLIGGSEAWERVAQSGRVVMAELDTSRMSPDQRRALRVHEMELNASLEQAKRVQYLAGRAPIIMIVLAIFGLAVIAIVSSRVAAHLSRQLSRPLNELVGWAGLIAKGKPLPDQVPPKRGAPEFAILRKRMRGMAEELEVARDRELEAERLSAFREAARRVAHELKNPLTPIRFAVARLKREVPPSLMESVTVLETEAARLETLATTFSQFGRLPEGPPSAIDVAELARYTARATVPDDMEITVTAPFDVPLAWGQHEPLARALANVLLNAVDACSSGGTIEIVISHGHVNGKPGITLEVRDSGRGIEPEQLATIWEPYYTSKPGGTGLGLAIARQAVEANGGKVSAESKLGTGTTIRFTLPCVDGTPSELNLSEETALRFGA